MFLCGLFVLSYPIDTAGDGLRNPPPGAFGLSRGGGKIAHIDDASAAFINPANLVDLSESSFMIDPSFIHIDRQVDAANGASADTTDPLKVLGSLFLAYPSHDDRYAFALGLTVPYGQSVEYDDDFAFRFLTPHFTELKVISFSPTAAIKINDNVLVGVGIDLMWSELKLRQSFPWSAVTMNPSSPDGGMGLEATGYAIGGIVGFTWSINPRHRLAFTYRPPFDIDYSGDFDISNVPAPAAGIGVTPSSDFDTEINYPEIWTIGYGVQLTGKVRLGADVERLKWSDFKELELDVGNNSVLFPSTTIPQDFEDTWTAGISADWQLSQKWTVRGGYWRIETPIPKQTQAPNLPESDFHLLGIGAKRSAGRHAFELAYAALLYDDRDVSGNRVPAFDGSYDTTAHIVNLSYSYSWQR